MTAVWYFTACSGLIMNYYVERIAPDAAAHEMVITVKKFRSFAEQYNVRWSLRNAFNSYSQWKNNNSSGYFLDTCRGFSILSLLVFQLFIVVEQRSSCLVKICS